MTVVELASGLGSALAVGIDIAEEQNGLDLIALDADRHVVESAGKLTVRDAARMVLTDLQPKIVCIDSPSGWALSGNSRMAERDLHNCGIHIYFTPSNPAGNPFYRWMETGIELYRALSPAYPLYRGGLVVGTAAEVFPNASAVLLAGKLRADGVTKNSFRRGVLRSQGVEATKEQLRNLHRVDAALAALTGLLALEGTYSTVGDQSEGVILLPVNKIPGSLHGRTPLGASSALEIPPPPM
jgi:predicted nuclease with RNAse H fold